jgi:hypothetical protein
MAVTESRPDGLDALTDRLRTAVRRFRSLLGLFGLAGCLLVLGFVLDTLGGQPTSGEKALNLAGAMLGAYGVLFAALAGLALVVSLAASGIRAVRAEPDR